MYETFLYINVLINQDLASLLIRNYNLFINPYIVSTNQLFGCNKRFTNPTADWASGE